MENLDMQSPDLVNENFEKLAALFPNCVTEGAEGKAIDFDLLKQELSHAVVEGNKERYRLEWPGKREAIVTANLPTTKTLRPVREDSVDFDNTENLYIEGDNLEVLKLLQESYLGKVKMIYIDPPYNTGKDFVYKDNFSKDAQDELIESGQTDEYNQRLVANPETAGRYHSDWLSMMYPRLKLARNLLTNDGVIFISIDDSEVENLKKLGNDVFGEDNFINQISIKAKASSGASGGGEDKRLKKNIEYLLVFTKSSSFESFNSIYKNQPLQEYIGERKKSGKNFAYKSVIVNHGKESFFKTIKAGNGDDIQIKKVAGYELKSISKLMKEEKLTEKEIYEKYFEDIITLENAQTSIRDRVIDACGNEDEYYNCYYKPISGRNKGVMTKVGFMGATKRLVSHLSNVAEKIDGEIIKKDKVGTLWDDLSWSSVSLEGDVKYNNGKKPTALISRILEMYGSENDIILDFFSGSASTAHSVLEKSSFGSKTKFIMVQLPENLEENLKSASSKKVKDEIKASINFLKSIAKPPFVTELGKERIRRAAQSIVNEQWSIVNGHKAELEKAKDKPDQQKIEDLQLTIDNLSSQIEKMDMGFRVYRLDTSNMQDVYYKPQDYDQGNLDLFADNVKTDRTADDLLAQVMLDWGLPLSLKIEQVDVSGKKVFKVAENSLYACFDSGIDEDFAKAIAKDEPLRIVFKDSGFKDDTAKTNVKQLLKQLSPETEMKVI